MPDRTVRQAIQWAAAELQDAGCQTPGEDATAIVAAALDRHVHTLAAAADDPLPPLAYLRIADCVNRRAVCEPLAYILGHARFRDLYLQVDRRVMVPLPDSAPLVDLAHRLPRGSRVHDVGTGSGAIALAIKHERPDLTVTASDLCFSAIAIAKANAHRLRLPVAFSAEPWLPAGEYDLVVAHLPHIDVDGHVLRLPPEILGHQPPTAIYAGCSPNGLTVISELLLRVPLNTRIALQHAPSQTDTISAWLRDPHTVPATGPYGRITVGRVG